MEKKSILLAGFILVKFFLQYILISPEYDLHRDEYLYLDQANHLAWGYLSVPPVTSWISYLIKLLGNDVFWVKLFPALFGALTILVVWKAIEALKGNLFALTLGASCVLFSVLLRLNTLYQPNSLDVLCWTALYFGIIMYLNTENQKWLFGCALIFAIGFLNKYNIAFLLIGYIPAILLTKQRWLLINKKIVLPLVLALLLILPNLIWQYQNHFPVFHHLKELTDLHLVNVARRDFLISQLLFFPGALLVLISALYAIWFYAPFEKFKAFLWAIIFTSIIFLSLRAKDYYAIGIYPIYIAFGAVYLSVLFSRGWKRYLQPALFFLPVLFFIPMYLYAFPNKNPEYIRQHESYYKALGLLRWEDGKNHALPQDFADMLGWKELAYKVDSAYSHIPNPDQTLILCDNYGQAGAINYYTTKGIRAVSFNADYIHWFDLDQAYVNLIRIKNAREKEKEWEKTSPHFQTSFMADSITNEFAREYGTTIFVFIGTKVDINERIKTEIDEVRIY